MPKQSRTYLHIGLPKTGTTFLQGVLAANPDVLAAHGLRYPGRSADHFLAAQDVLEHTFRGHQDERAPGAWQALLDEVNDSPQSSIISHELFSLATEDKVAAVLSHFQPGNVTVIVTARDFLRQVPAVWQEDLKNGKTRTLSQFVERVKATDGQGKSRGFWGFQDLNVITARWASQVGRENLTLVTVPFSGSDQQLLWQRFSEAMNLNAPNATLPERRRNTSLGAVEAEFLRRFNEQVNDDLSWPQYRKLVKHTLVGRVLADAPQSAPIRLSHEDIRWAVDRSRGMVEGLAKQNYRVIGDIKDLVSVNPQEETDDERVVSETDVVDVGVTAISGLLKNIDRTTRKGRKAS